MVDESIALARAERSLLGLSVGDAFGERFFASSSSLDACLAARSMVGGPPAPWAWSDDTAMAIEVVACLRARGHLSGDALADALLRRYLAEPWRGYGGGAHRYFQSRSEGQPWARAAASLFDGQGSLGNGAAMRSGPIGAYFADDLDRVVAQAELGARVTHVHVDGVAGAIAIAVAAAMAVRTNAMPHDEARCCSPRCTAEGKARAYRRRDPESVPPKGSRA